MLPPDCGGRTAAVLVEDSLEELAPSCTMSAIWQMIFCLWSLMRCCVGSPRNVKVSRNIKFSGGEIINGGCRARIIFFNCHKMKIFIDKMCFLTELGPNSSILTSIKKVMFMYICQNCQTPQNILKISQTYWHLYWPSHRSLTTPTFIYTLSRVGTRDTRHWPPFTSHNNIYFRLRLL